MTVDRDDKLNSTPGSQDEFSLESILAEFGSKPTPPDNSPSSPPYTPEEKAEDAREKREEAFFFPNRPKQPPAPPKAGVITAFPGGGAAPEPDEDDEPTKPIPIIREPAPPPLPQEPEEPPAAPDNMVEFPTPPPDNPVAAGVDQLRRKADAFAGHMYENAGTEWTKSVRRAEKLIPGVDEEVAPPSRIREPKPKKVQPPPPDTSPAELFKQYAKGLKTFRLRTTLILLLFLPAAYLTFVHTLPPMPEPFSAMEPDTLRCWLMAAVQGLAMLLGIDVLIQGVARPFRGQTSMDTLCVLAQLAVLADAVSLPLLYPDGVPRLPFCAVSVLSLWCVMWGSLQKRRGQRFACHAAASASEPYRVTRDEGKWNSRDTYAKWSGTAAGFGSQIQTPDGAERIYRYITPVLILACLLFSLISSVGRGRPGDILWCLAATLTAACPLSATICFGLPWRWLSRRLSKSGAALAGWPGVTNTTGSSNILLTDIDLFPAGSVIPNGVKIFGDFSLERVVGLTASVIRDSGSGLDKVFHDLLRSHGAVYRRGELFTCYEGGGVSEVFNQDLVQVGSASFMVLMNVSLPPGHKVKNAVFCAINGELAGIFALNYRLPDSAPPALDSLIHNRITPVLCTRDFSLTPSMLRHKFRLPAEKMEFPAVERRRELSDPLQTHSSTLTAILCREGLSPYAEAVVGSRRLRTGVRLSAVLACLGGVVGALLAFYLTFVGAYAALTAGNLLTFLLAWLVPAPLIAGWTVRY